MDQAPRKEPCRPDFAILSRSTTYTVAVEAVNEIGARQRNVKTFTTPEAPNPQTGVNYQYPGPILAKFNPTTAATGQIVTVTGLKLNMIDRMQMGGKEVEFVIYSATELAMKIPFGLADGRYDVVVYSEFGKLNVQDALRVAGSPVNEDLVHQPVEPGQPSLPGDQDGDRVPDNLDADIDGDGRPNAVDPDIDGDGRPNAVDPDIDGDGIPNDYDPNPVSPNAPEDALDTPRDDGTDSSVDEDLPATAENSGGINWLLIVGFLALSLTFGAALTIVMRKRKIVSVVTDSTLA
ncbi:thrombospondin type 3 repeat-containing protein [Candidatus Aquiluna sp. UB-MaderosW2red]|uniref:thrombospondin type 3 repeat-containing protein n=1 Tax=Candidatus Aquiluna sp. UB-MaderosW2red TaxID=1855377 RepID=UPI000875C05A|nr:thrombospondin type 3 repeat-containing protein [Candidatus Aquiluna sp. UB-MaderosW2red]SCX15466.1 hypothetical protein SAMN05216534_1656 [Candidatus Aquiluna sp. UB-MaderosW2red]